MAELKFKIKKCGLVRKINGEKVKGYYGKVITNGKATFDEIARESAKNTTLHPKEEASQPSCCWRVSARRSSRASSWIWGR